MLIERRRIAGWAALSIMLLSIGGSLAGCTEMAVGAGATVAEAAAEERGVKGVATDSAIAANINALWFDYNADIVTHVGVTVTEGRVLLTGSVPTQKMRLDAVRIAWRSPGVKQVINEIKVSGSEGIEGYARDSWITAQLIGRLTLDSRVQSINYSVETVKGTVYLMGIAQSQAELDRVRNHARYLRYVRHIVSYVRIKGHPPPGKGGS